MELFLDFQTPNALPPNWNPSPRISLVKHSASDRGIEYAKSTYRSVHNRRTDAVTPNANPTDTLLVCLSANGNRNCRN